MMSALFHVIRTLVKRGLQVESYCRSRDASGRGMMDKKSFTGLLRRIGLPFSRKELAEIAGRYTVPSSDMVDYETLLKDVGILGEYGNNSPILEGTESQESLCSTDIGTYTGVLLDVKRMLLESVNSLGKNMEDLYRMFARWDTDGTGTVTATQFLRVLARLHVDLSDQDQDLVVELLDFNAKGRIDFLALLTFCFAESENISGSPIFLSGNADDATNGETLSAVSTEGLNEQKSVGSGGHGGNRRPHTATSTRPVAPEQMYNQRTAGNGADVYVDRRRESKGLGSVQVSSGQVSVSGSGSGSGGGDSVTKGRPLTASARVSTNQHERHTGGDAKKGSRNNDGHTNFDINEDGSNENHRRDDPQFVVQLPDDVIDDDDDLMLLTPHSSMFNNRQRFHEESYSAHRSEHNLNAYEGVDGHDGVSLNDNTLITDHDDFFSSPQGNLTTLNSRDMWNSQSLDGLTTSLEVRTNQPLLSSPSNSHLQRVKGNPNHSEDLAGTEPNEHLSLLASQTLATVREMVISRQRTGKALEEIYRHFDRQNKSYFDAQDFIRATSDLRIETSERVAHLAIRQIALDGKESVTLGEFKVFVTDTEHWKLEKNVHQQMARELEKQGRKYQTLLLNVFWEQDEQRQGNKVQAGHTGLVSRDAFVSAFQMLAVRVSMQELGRLVTRFDIGGNGKCSVTRFLNMAQSCDEWRAAEKRLAIQEEAQEEATNLRRQIRENGIASVPDDVIAMAEFLGIRVISEQYMLWIARDALRAPLPINWTAQRDSKGRVFFYNHLNNQSTWDHPLDSHFRSLRDKYRRGGGSEGERGVIAGTVSFGASLGPPPLNIQVFSTGSARPEFPSGHFGVGGEATRTYSYGGYLPAAVNRSSSITRPNSAGAHLGHGLAAIQSSSVRVTSATSNNLSWDSQEPSVMPSAFGRISGASNNGMNRPRPQSALPERLVAQQQQQQHQHQQHQQHQQHGHGEKGIVWRDESPHVTRLGDSPPISTDGGLEVAGSAGGPFVLSNTDVGHILHQFGHRPASAPNYASSMGLNYRPKSGYGKVDLSASGNNLSGDKKHTVNSIYRAPYFDMSHFNKKGGDESAEGPTVGSGRQQHRKKPAIQRSRDVGGSNISHSRKGCKSTVDRAVRLGKEIPSYLLPREKDPRDREKERLERSLSQQRDSLASNQKLATMYDDSLFQRLDKTFTTTPAYSHAPPPIERVEPKGGVVVL